MEVDEEVLEYCPVEVLATRCRAPPRTQRLETSKPSVAGASGLAAGYRDLGLSNEAKKVAGSGGDGLLVFAPLGETCEAQRNTTDIHHSSCFGFWNPSQLDPESKWMNQIRHCLRMRFAISIGSYPLRPLGPAWRPGHGSNRLFCSSSASSFRWLIFVSDRCDRHQPHFVGRLHHVFSILHRTHMKIQVTSSLDSAKYAPNDGSFNFILFLFLFLPSAAVTAAMTHTH